MNARDYADRIVAELAGPGLRKAARHTLVDDTSALSDLERCNLRAKELFVDAIEAAGLGAESVRDLALFFGVKRSKLFERMCRRRTDLAPLPEWFARLERHTVWNQLNAEFARRA